MADADNDAIKPEELQAFLRQYTPENKLGRERDMLSGHYRIAMNEPLTQFSSSMAKAYVARDTQNAELQIYALVFENNAIPRRKNILALKEYRHPNLVALLDEGVADISTHNESRYVVIMERPIGKPLSEMLSATQKNPVSDSTIVNYMLRPFTEILRAFAGLGISHNRINLQNVYINNATLQIGECVSEPSGYSQDPVFEPIDRILTSPWGKPDYAIDADCYALGVLSLHLMIGFQAYSVLSPEEFIARMLAKGSYHTLVIPWDISEQFQDLFRALLNDAKRDRCAPEHIENWIGGRRFNLILPAVNQETARGFDFAGQSYFNRKMLAHALFLNWAEAKSVLFDTRLSRWLETGIHKKDLADAVARIASSSLGDTPKAERQNNELLARIIIMLDPTGPVRYKTLSFSPDGVGTLFAHLYLTGDQENLQTLQQAIDNDLSGFWLEVQKTVSENVIDISRLQRARNFLRMRSPGFGVERCLYDLNPSLPCQSPLVKQYCVTTLPVLFFALDAASTNARAADINFMDMHVAAFIGSKLDLGKEIRIHELDDIKELAANPQLVSVKLLARVQHQLGSKTARGLTHWVVLRLFSMADHVHRRDMRHKMQRRLQDAAGSGKISEVADVVLSPDVFVSDYRGFGKAAHAFQVRKHQIARLNDPRERKRHARMVGRGLAQTLAYGTSLFTIYFTIRSYFHI